MVVKLKPVVKPNYQHLHHNILLYNNEKSFRKNFFWLTKHCFLRSTKLSVNKWKKKKSFCSNLWMFLKIKMSSKWLGKNKRKVKYSESSKNKQILRGFIRIVVFYGNTWLEINLKLRVNYFEFFNNEMSKIIFWLNRTLTGLSTITDWP